MKTYDTIIIGAGPAGLSCAKLLAEAKKSVLVLEQNKVIGPKACAGGLTRRDLEYLHLPGRLLDKKCKKVVFHTPLHKKAITLDDYFVYTIDRKNLGQWQLGKLHNTCAVIRTCCRVTEIKQDYIVVNETEKIGFKHLVGADGSSSIVRKYLGLKTSRLDIAFQYIIPAKAHPKTQSKKYQDLEIFLDSDLFKSWYAWIFPHKYYVSIGCGCDPRFVSLKELTENFNTWLKRNKIDVSKGEYQAHPISFDYQGYRFGNIFLAGDAAGLASALTGEGIYPALRSGEEIAKIILDPNYTSLVMKELLSTRRLHNQLLSISEKAGPIRKTGYELVLLLLGSKLVAKRLLNLLTW